MQPVLVKAYGHFKPAGPEYLKRLAQLMSSYGLDEESASLNGRILLISHEGTFFPADEALEILSDLAKNTAGQVEAKLDVLDLEGWMLHRHEWQGDEFKLSSRPLNSVLEYSGH
ncbi:hypothetical protein LJC48_03260 [Desulfovibrio sp. OttesenSCG-928-C06]|nr:hypothetical protein [Desulfovibrio sp. OttesenSCG-928-C06]